MIKFELSFKPEALAKIYISGGPESTAATVEAVKKILLEDPTLEPLRELFDISVRNTDDETHEESPKSTSTKLDISKEEIDSVEELVKYVANSTGMLTMISRFDPSGKMFSTDEILEANGVALVCKRLAKKLRDYKGE